MYSTVESSVLLSTHQWSLVLSYVQYSGVKWCAMYTSLESSVVLCTVQWCLVWSYVQYSGVVLVQSYEGLKCLKVRADLHLLKLQLRRLDDVGRRSHTVQVNQQFHLKPAEWTPA